MRHLITCPWHCWRPNQNKMPVGLGCLWISGTPDTFQRHHGLTTTPRNSREGKASTITRVGYQTSICCCSATSNTCHANSGSQMCGCRRIAKTYSDCSTWFSPPSTIAPDASRIHLTWWAVKLIISTGPSSIITAFKTCILAKRRRQYQVSRRHLTGSGGGERERGGEILDWYSPSCVRCVKQNK